MAVYRQIQTTFWQDSFVLSLTPEEKYFYIYLMTNSKTKQCGIYELPLQIAQIETGYNRETVIKLIQKFIEHGKIAYDWETNEVAMKNWLKYNPFENNPLIKKCVSKELLTVKNRSLIEFVECGEIEPKYPLQAVSQQKEKEKEKQEEKEKESSYADGRSFEQFLLQTWGHKDGRTSPSLAKQYIELGDRHGWDKLFEAIETAEKYNKKSFAYVKGILEPSQTKSGEEKRSENAMEAYLKKKGAK